MSISITTDFDFDVGDLFYLPENERNLLIECVSIYSSAGLLSIVQRIKDAFLSIFGCSSWQKSIALLSSYPSAPHFMLVRTMIGKGTPNREIAEALLDTLVLINVVRSRCLINTGTSLA